MRIFTGIFALMVALLITLPAQAQLCSSTGTTLHTLLTVSASSQVNLRADPDTSARIVTALQTGNILTIVGGPVCARGLNWWQVIGAQNGWVAEASGSTRYLEAAPVTTAELRGPLDGLTVTFPSEIPATLRPADQCPPISGEISINHAMVDDPFVSGRAAFFVDSGFAGPFPSLCIPAARASEARVFDPTGRNHPPSVQQVTDNPDFVRVTLPENALAHPGRWRVLVGEFTLDIEVLGPFGPLVDARTTGGRTNVFIAGFAPEEPVTILAATVMDESASDFRAVTITTDATGVAAADLEGVEMPVLAAVSESGLIALPPFIEALNVEGAESQADVFDAVYEVLWGDPQNAEAEPTVVADLVNTTDTDVIEDASSATPEPTTAPADDCTYTVQRGDNFYRIALNHGLTTAELLAANPQITNPRVIFAGNELTIPGCG